MRKTKCHICYEEKLHLVQNFFKGFLAVFARLLQIPIVTCFGGLGKMSFQSQHNFPRSLRRNEG